MAPPTNRSAKCLVRYYNVHLARNRRRKQRRLAAALASLCPVLFSFINFVPVTVKNRVRVSVSSRVRVRVRV